MKIKAVVITIIMMLSGVFAFAQELTQWTLCQEGSKQGIKVTVPCTVAGALNQAGVFGKDVVLHTVYMTITTT